MFGFDEKVQRMEEKLKEEGYWFYIHEDRTISINTPSDISFKLRDYGKEYEKREKAALNAKEDIFCSSNAKRTYENSFKEVARAGEILKEAGFDPKKGYKVTIIENTLAHKEPIISDFDYASDVQACWFNVEGSDGSFHRLWGTRNYDSGIINIVEEVKTMELDDGSKTSLLNAKEYCSLPSGDLQFETDFINENYNIAKKVQQVSDALCPESDPELEKDDLEK